MSSESALFGLERSRGSIAVVCSIEACGRFGVDRAFFSIECGAPSRWWWWLEDVIEMEDEKKMSSSSSLLELSLLLINF